MNQNVKTFSWHFLSLEDSSKAFEKHSDELSSYKDRLSQLHTYFQNLSIDGKETLHSRSRDAVASVMLALRTYSLLRKDELYIQKGHDGMLNSRGEYSEPDFKKLDIQIEIPVDQTKFMTKKGKRINYALQNVELGALENINPERKLYIKTTDTAKNGNEISGYEQLQFGNKLATVSLLDKTTFVKILDDLKTALINLPNERSEYVDAQMSERLKNIFEFSAGRKSPQQKFTDFITKRETAHNNGTDFSPSKN